MSLTNPNKVVTEQRLHDFYEELLPYLGGMPEVLANKFSKGDLYDTTEKMIGKWIDGKPLYQKTVTYTNPSAIGNNTVNELVLEEDATKEYIDSEIIFIANWGTAPYYHYRLPYYQYSDDGALYVDMKPQLKTGRAQVKLITHNYNYAANDIIFKATLRYTKTTDSANSFNIGEATDYSTDEKIVGTWIDGSPLYQKTISFGSFTGTSGEKHIDFINETFGMVVNSSTFIVFADGYQTNLPLNTYSENNGNFYYRFFTDNNDNKGVVHLYWKDTYDDMSKATMCVTLQYTKTTS